MAADTRDEGQEPVASSSRLPDVVRPLPAPSLQKLAHWALYRSIGSPRLVVAPMVDASELAWRILSRLHGAELCYTPMIHATIFNVPANDKYRQAQFDLETGEEGDTGFDRPLFAQFCANDPETFLKAAMQIAETGKVDAIDLNLGCPQGIAKKGHYGAFLMEDWALIERLSELAACAVVSFSSKRTVYHLHTHLPIPITAKFRVYDDIERSVAYAKMLERAGAQIITCHGRTREQKGHKTGLADWRKIRAIKEVVRIPVLANGNILTHNDIERCLKETGADGVMSAEGNLYNPALFAPIASLGRMQSYRASLPAALREALDEVDKGSVDQEASPLVVTMCRRYLAIVANLKTPTSMGAIKAHMFKLFQPVFEAGQHLDLRPMLGAAGQGKDRSVRERVGEYLDVVAELEKRVKKEEEKDGKIAYFRLQPFIRQYVASTDVLAVKSDVTKRAPSPSSPEHAPKSKVLKVVPCPGACQPNNIAAVDCSQGMCFVCCSAGANCVAHERKRQKIQDKRNRHKERKATRALQSHT